MDNNIKINNINIINDINHIIKQPLLPKQCLINPNMIEKKHRILHPLINTLLFNNNCYTIPKGYTLVNNINENDKINISGIYSYFHFPINQYNFSHMIYGINDIIKFNDWLDDNIDTITELSINRILYSFMINNNKQIKENIDLFIEIIIKILKKLEIDNNNKYFNKIILNIIKEINDNNNKINKNNILDIIKKYLKK